MNTESPIKLKLDSFVFETGVHNGKNGFCVVFPYNRKHTTQLKIRKKPIEASPTRTGSFEQSIASESLWFRA